MVLIVIAHIFALLLELARISRISDHDKDLEILMVRYQLGTRLNLMGWTD